MAEEPQYETRAERRAADAANRRVGAHRAGASAGSYKAATAVVVVLALVAVLLIVGAVRIILSAGSDPEAKVEEQQQVEPGADDSKDESSKSAEPSESESGEASEGPSDEASESTPSDGESTGSSDVKTVAGESGDPNLSILNASGVNGAARKYADQYESQGWTLGRVGNAGTNVSSTTVYYSSSEYRDAAERVAEGLGGVSVEQSSRYRVGVTIIMGPDVANSDPAEG